MLEVTMEQIYQALGVILQDKAEKNKNINATFQFDIGGDDPLAFHITLENGVPTMGLGTNDKANLTVSMTAAHFKEMVEGKLNGVTAFMSGKIKIKGDMALAMKLENILRP